MRATRAVRHSWTFDFLPQLSTRTRCIEKCFQTLGLIKRFIASLFIRSIYVYLYIFQTSKYHPSIFYSRNIHFQYFPKKNQFHQLASSPIFFRKIVNIDFNRSTLGSLFFLVFGEWNDARHQRTPICQFVIPRGCIATRHASIALPSHESRAFSFRVSFRDYTRDHPRIQFPRTSSSQFRQASKIIILLVFFVTLSTTCSRYRISRISRWFSIRRCIFEIMEISPSLEEVEREGKMNDR